MNTEQFNEIKHYFTYPLKNALYSPQEIFPDRKRA